MPKAQETVLEINLSALGHNYNYLKSKVNASVKLMAVVKAYGYGSDSVMVAKELQSLGADYFAVAYISEGVRLRDEAIATPILVLHPLANGFKELINRCLEPSIYSLKTLKEFIATAETLGQKEYPIHLKFNSGLNRLGFNEQDVPEMNVLLKNTTAVKVTSLMSHLVASEDHSLSEFTQHQISTFIAFSEGFKAEFGYMPMRHQSNTSGILNYPEAHFDMVRSGIGLYGYGNSVIEDRGLKPIAALKSVISQIHKITKGNSVGYNRGFIAENETLSATIPLGHADGIGRQYGKGKGCFIVNGKKAPILGNVCMDMTMVDVTDIECEEGDEVIIFGGPQNASEFAKGAQTISYEILTSVSQRIKRTFCR
jgi:alanine racemase